MSPFGKSHPEPEPVEVQGRPLQCVVCRHGAFWRRDAQLHGGVATFLNLEWMSPTAACLVCSRCGYVHWFLPVGE